MGLAKLIKRIGLLVATMILPLSSCMNVKAGNVVKIPERPQVETSEEETVYSVSATDALGRSFDAVGKRNGKYVGIFYFLWTGQHGSTGNENGTFDNSKMSLEEMRSETNLLSHHYWGEPLYGYYDSGDPWVFRKHMELLTMAGVDYLVFDATNHYTYFEVLANLLPVAQQMLDAGWRVPKISFMCNSYTKDTVQEIYDAFFGSDDARFARYRDLWFCAEDGAENADGKPWIIGRDNGTGEGDSPDARSQNYSQLPQKVLDAFHFRPAQWPNEAGAVKDGFLYHYQDNGFPWMSWETAESGREQYNHNGLMSVSIAQHVSGVFSDSVTQIGSYDRNYGRGWSYENGAKNLSDRVPYGSNFQEQWNYAISKSTGLNNVFVTGWNEWVAQKQRPGSGRATTFFVDCVNEEFSRDAEMTKGGSGDNYYLQLANNIRSFKRDVTAPLPIAPAADGFLGAQSYLDFAGDTAPRDYKSSNTFLPNYTDSSGRNDVVQTTVAYDKDNVYFWIDCAGDIVGAPADNTCWMNLLLSVDDSESSGWNGYQFVVNRSFEQSAGDKIVSRVSTLNADGTIGTSAGGATVTVSGTRMSVGIPRSVLGISDERFTLRFKVADNVTRFDDLMDYYSTGDCAPIGRLNYTFRAGKRG